MGLHTGTALGAMSRNFLSAPHSSPSKWGTMICLSCRGSKTFPTASFTSSNTRAKLVSTRVGRSSLMRNKLKVTRRPGRTTLMRYTSSAISVTLAMAIPPGSLADYRGKGGWALGGVLERIVGERPGLNSGPTRLPMPLRLPVGCSEKVYTDSIPCWPLDSRSSAKFWRYKRVENDTSIRGYGGRSVSLRPC